MVPTLTMFGRFSECTRWPIEGVAVVTRRIIACGKRACRAGGPVAFGRVDHASITVLITSECGVCAVAPEY
jgi:hypothetical protein